MAKTFLASPQKDMFGKCSRRRESVEIKVGLYTADKFFFFDCNHRCKNQIWYPCYLSLEAQYLGKIVKFFWRLIKLVHKSKLTPRAKFQNQLSFRICYPSLPEAFIISTLLTEMNAFTEYESTSIDRLDGPSIRFYKCFFFEKAQIQLI